MKFEIQFTGHENVRSLHPRTIEITKESHLTVQGDCIVGVNASHSCLDIPQELKQSLQNNCAKVKLSLIVGDHIFEINGFGSKDLSLTHPTDIVIRLSEFVCPRTLAIKCNKASSHIPREIIELLQDPKTEGRFTIEIE